MMSRIATFFGLAEANDKIFQLSKILTILLPIVSATINLSTTFFMIFIAEWAGGGDFITGLSLMGILIVIQMAIQTLFDYPTAALGDYLGHRYIIASSFLSFAASFFMISVISISTPVWYILIVFIMMGFANSQLSGAFMAWFDNNYRAAMPGDKDRKAYGVFWGKVGMLFQIIATLVLIPGSILAVALGRSWVFQFQAVMCVMIAIVVLRVVKDFPEVRETRQEKPSMNEYTAILKQGLRFLFSDKYVTYIILGGCLVMSVGMVWSELILFPMYFSYLITDVAVSSFRTILFVPGIFQTERSGVWSRRFEPKKWIPRFRFLQGTGFVFYMAFAAIMYFFPPASVGVDMVILTIPYTQIAIMQLPANSILPILLMAITFISSGFFGGFAEILTQRELLDVIPNKIRNSMYSLSPTIGILFAMPMIATFGWLIPAAGFPLTMILCAIISLAGVAMIAKGLSHPKPLADNLEKKAQVTEMVVVEE
ncbi:MAG: MFS transporter [Candidatus Thorarchaeota archaeon]